MLSLEHKNYTGVGNKFSPALSRKKSTRQCTTVCFDGFLRIFTDFFRIKFLFESLESCVLAKSRFSLNKDPLRTVFSPFALRAHWGFHLGTIQRVSIRNFALTRSSHLRERGKRARGSWQLLCVCVIQNLEVAYTICFALVTRTSVRRG